MLAPTEKGAHAKDTESRNIMVAQRVNGDTRDGQGVGEEARDGSRDQVMKNMHGFYFLGQFFFTMICLWKEMIESLVRQYIIFKAFQHYKFNIINSHCLFDCLLVFNININDEMKPAAKL